MEVRNNTFPEYLHHLCKKRINKDGEIEYYIDDTVADGESMGKKGQGANANLNKGAV